MTAPCDRRHAGKGSAPSRNEWRRPANPDVPGRETRMRTARDHDLFSKTTSLLLSSTSAGWLGISRGAGGRCAMRVRSRQPWRSHAVLALLGSLLILTVSAASHAMAA